MGKLARIAMALLFFCGLLSASCAPHPDDNSHQSIHSVTGPFEFSVPKWEFDTLRHDLWESLKPASKIDINDTETVREYFASVSSSGSLAESQKADLEDKTERILAKQIREAVIEEGIINLLDSYIPIRVVFPPINFEFESPPSLLAISPRDKIKLLRRIPLKPGLTTEEKEKMETQVDSLGYSSLVVGLGGEGFTYPTMVYETSNIRRAIDIAVEEWFHQYMGFHPLGFLYALDTIGWRPDFDIATMNETVAGIVSKEIGAKIYQKYYASGNETVPPRETESEFGSLMRQIRIQVDEYLAQGEVARAEEFMKERRDFLASKGYYIRKLNQAYFAFHGTYADEPATLSPIGQDLQKLRAQCSSLKEFLNKVTGMTGYADLKKVAEESGK